MNRVNCQFCNKLFRNVHDLQLHVVQCTCEVENSTMIVPRQVRVKTVPAKFKCDEYEMKNEPSGTCPKCTKYVLDDGVVCGPCNAFWHYHCASITQKDVDELGEDEFYCEKHSNEAVNSVVRQNDRNVEKEVDMCALKKLEDNDLQQMFRNVKAVSYTHLTLPTICSV